MLKKDFSVITLNTCMLLKLTFRLLSPNFSIWKKALTGLGILQGMSHENRPVETDRQNFNPANLCLISKLFSIVSFTFELLSTSLCTIALCTGVGILDSMKEALQLKFCKIQGIEIQKTYNNYYSNYKCYNLYFAVSLPQLYSSSEPWV